MKKKPPVPESVRSPLIEGLDHDRTGKVCQLFYLPDYEGMRFKLFGNNASVHDVPLPFLVPGKGRTLNLIDYWWRSQMPWVKHDVVAMGRAIDRFLPKHLRGNPDYHQRGRIIKHCQPLLVELVFRWLLTGTGLSQYKESGGFICGQKMPDGLIEWSEMNPSAVTPTTKSQTGHDEPMLITECTERFGYGPVALTHPLFELARRIAHELGLIIADTKFEVGLNEKGELVLIDEVLTPDTSRIFTKAELALARANPGYKPKSFDKQPIRNYVWDTLGVGPKTELTPEVVSNVQSHNYPDELIRQTSGRYDEILNIFTRKTAEDYVLTLAE
ncbi:MAG: phosphoribosylaminoimidazolesuccinocarboxamide synthase [bacterium]|nr:phosphoribosylaminoimidazolesuccinocarboxamide synthase [bacterium]